MAIGDGRLWTFHFAAHEDAWSEEPMMRVGGLSRLDHLHIVCRQVVERVVGVVVLLLAVLSPVVATFGQLQVHHLSVMVMMHSHCYHCEHNGKADYDYGQSFVHSAAKVKILFHIYKYYKLFFYDKMFVLYRLCASMPPTAWIVCRNKAAREVRCPQRASMFVSEVLWRTVGCGLCGLCGFARAIDVRTQCFALLRGSESTQPRVPRPGCATLARG